MEKGNSFNIRKYRKYNQKWNSETRDKLPGNSEQEHRLQLDRELPSVFYLQSELDF